MNTAILGTGSYLPREVLTSAELGDRLGVGEQWIMDRTRIRERRVAAPDEATSDLATQAAHEAIRDAGLTAADIDLIIVATSTPDQPMPASACLVQANLGAWRAAAFDVEAVCSGFVYALVIAHAMLVADAGPHTALVIGADTYSRVLDYTDRKTAVLFGDGAGAVVLGKAPHGRGLMASLLGADGAAADFVQVPAGGSRRPASHETVNHGEHYFAMKGREVRKMAEQVLPEVVVRLTESAGIDLRDVGLIVPHQANGVILEAMAASLELPRDLMHVTVDKYGNTGAASVPVTLDDAARNGRLTPGRTVLLVAFGGGMTWAGAALHWHGPARHRKDPSWT
ncbi:3-oxoacyl-ACP synthase III family protein [Amycolatopsis thermoflava]|uniref:3-oxoacyl-ACP synthase III family protein n=1 Tax=Amycolatopsis thermoflava TaxID=84480 RepID=UPI00364F95BB